jgi:hypothetical protein
MSTIHPHYPQLPQSLLSLSGQTSSAANQSGANDLDASLPASDDTLTLSSAAQSPDLASALAQVEQQNHLAALNNPAEALVANQAAAAFIGSQSGTALGVQANLSSSSVLSMTSGA